jgi:hypothetical protein
VQALQIQIDEARKSHEVAQIVGSDYIQELRARAKTLRARVTGEEDEE